MLPRHHRLTRPQDFRWTIRGGKKAVTSTLVMHALLTHDVETPARVGITVSKAVGGSVVRHRVARQIRHAIAADLPTLPAGSLWVIRALPGAGESSLVADDVITGLGQLRGVLA